MDPELHGHEEREELLAEHDAEHGAHDELSSPRRQPAKRRSVSIVMLLVCSLTVLILASFALLNWSQHQESPLPQGDDGQKQGGGSPGETGDADATTPGKPADSAGDGDSPRPRPVIPPDREFDLTQTGFVVASPGNAQLREYFFNITRGTGAPDGVSKSMILVNGQSPGPLIEANMGDTIRVVVHNSMPEEKTSIHWHGIDQRDSVWMDGVAGVTQCSIPPGKNFTYEFAVPKQRGTFWYHGHVSVQYTDGLFGPLIIHDPDEKVPPVDEDKILFIGDLHHMDGRQATAEYLSTSPSWSPMMSGTEPYPDNIVINGRHVFACSTPKAARHEGEEEEEGGEGSESPPTGCASGSLHTARIKSKASARLRLISHSSNTPFWFTVDSHTLQIVEIDGVEVEPVATTRVFLNPGQRYSVVLRADQPPGNYLMRVSPTCAMLDNSPESSLSKVGSQATAVLSYDGTDAAAAPVGRAWDVSSTSVSPAVGQEPWASRCHDLPFDLAKPMRQLDAYDPPTRNRHAFIFRFVDDSKGVRRTSIDGTIFSPIENGASLWQVPNQNVTTENMNSNTPQWVFEPNQHVFVSRDEGKAAQIAISAGNMMGHPWHLHGQNFQVVGWGRGEFGKSQTTWNLKNPLRRDTVTVPGHSHVVIRYIADNPGVWALHCHIQWHAEGGMFVQTAQGLGSLQKMIGSLGDGGKEDIRGKFCSAASGRRA